MKILYICHRFPFPPQRGGKIRPFNVIRHLSKKHDVTVASIARSVEEAEAGKGLADYCVHYLMEIVTVPLFLSNVVRRFSHANPLSMEYFYSKKLHQRIHEEIKHTRFDLILVHCSSVAQYVEDVMDIPKILDFGDMDSQKWLLYSEKRRFPLNKLYLLEGTRLKKAEARLAKKFDYCSCTTQEEMKTLEDYHLDIHPSWFPNGVDTEYFRPTDTPYESDTICFIGRMDYYPNQECMLHFCHHILPRIREKRPNVKLSIIGANPSKEIRALAKLPGIAVTGTVKDVRSFVQRSAVNVAPLNIARGTQNKILESLAMGVPTVASRAAADGVDAVSGEDFLVGADDAELADGVVRLLESHEERMRFSEKGRARMLSHHSWERSMRILDEIIADRMRENPNAQKQ